MKRAELSKARSGDARIHGLGHSLWRSSLVTKIQQTVAAAIVMTTTGATIAQCGPVDQSNYVFEGSIPFAWENLAQSFQTQSATNICGAGIRLEDGGGSDLITIDLWTDLPSNIGAVRIGTGIPVVATGGTWCYVAFEENCVAIIPDTTYFLLFGGTNNLLAIRHSDLNPYPWGTQFFGPPWTARSNSDFVFETYSCCGGTYFCDVTGVCPGTITVNWSGAAPNSQQAILFGLNTGGTTIPSGPCAGTVLCIRNDVRVVIIIPTNANGAGTISGSASNAACNHFLQLITAGSCTTSIVAQI